MLSGCVTKAESTAASLTQAEEPLSTLVLLAAHLESGRLADFWALAQGSRDLLGMGGWQGGVGM